MQVYQSTEIQYTLTKEQREALSILSIGTFLEYFDLMLYVHMAVVLNDLFFPKTDPHTAQLLSAFAFCSTFVFRPVGAIIFGWIGDTIGRKQTIVITNILMALCCCAMAGCPTYAEIGITASYIMITCRVLQGMASMGEVVGALLYLTEFIKKPIRFFAVGLVPVFCGFGSLCAIAFAALATSILDNWRFAFGAGVIIAAYGILARTALKETPEFIDANARLKRVKELACKSSVTDEKDEKFFNKVDGLSIKSLIALFLTECIYPLCFYFCYVFCSDLLKHKFGYTSAQVINHNLVVTIIAFSSGVIKSFLCKIFHPFQILKWRWYIAITVYTAIPFWLGSISSGLELGILQVLVYALNPDAKFAMSAMYGYFPVFKRFKVASFMYALPRALIYVVTTFGVVYLVNWFGNWGMFLAFAIVSSGSIYGFRHFWKLEEATGDLKRYTIIKESEA